ncbi:hypothetical protein K1719_010056 [Acacia pycnantha]|nr:hypothetical protein K1719_010056 [Acacia pycnantha]
MVLKLCLMASHSYPPGLVLEHELGLGGNLKGFQPLLPSAVTKPEIIRYHSPALRSNPCEESLKSQSGGCFNSNQFVNFDPAAQRPLLNDVQANCPDAVLFGFGIVEKCTKHDKIVQFLRSGASETETSGERMSSIDTMNWQLLGSDVPQQSFSTPLIYPNSPIDIQKFLLDFIGDSAFSSNILVHPDGLVSFLGTGSEMKDFLSIVAESYLSKNSYKGEKHYLLVPHFSRLDINEAEARTQKTQSTLTAPLKSPEKVKVKPSSKKKRKVGRERDLYKRNNLHACIAGTGLAVLLSVIWRVACGRVPFCASKFFTTGFGFALVWLSWAVNNLRDTIVGTSKNTGKLGLKDSSNSKEEEIIQKLDKNIRDIYFRSAALLAMAVLSVA